MNSIFQINQFREKLVLVASVSLLIAPSIALAGRVLEGRVTNVRDVDTIVVTGTVVRLNGVDGPEISSRVGRDAKLFMERLVGGKVVKCELNGERTYDRWVGVCFLKGNDIGKLAVQEGHALDCARYSGGRYRKFETRAARSKINRANYC
jgi:endonuclease YncB( thermonuclease family)